jgi:hypothetical protein
MLQLFLFTLKLFYSILGGLDVQLELMFNSDMFSDVSLKLLDNLFIDFWATHLWEVSLAGDVRPRRSLVLAPVLVEDVTDFLRRFLEIALFGVGHHHLVKHRLLQLVELLLGLIGGLGVHLHGSHLGLDILKFEINYYVNWNVYILQNDQGVKLVDHILLLTIFFCLQMLDVLRLRDRDVLAAPLDFEVEICNLFLNDGQIILVRNHHRG